MCAADRVTARGDAYLREVQILGGGESGGSARASSAAGVKKIGSAVFPGSALWVITGGTAGAFTQSAVCPHVAAPGDC